mmetsp:Transcript_18477/g.18164  ORF Transcript_18477/g.18164 Transcript_18477/m.18164 type:complete len:269 (+) Transcript_18477:1294-2100(+)
MALWPRFTTIFDHFLNNIEKAKAKNYKLYNLSVHFTTKRYVSLVLMLYKIADKTGHNMLLSRLTKLQNLMLKFIESLSVESFIGSTDHKSKFFFLVNNIHYIYALINQLHISIELKDLERLEKRYTEDISKFITTTLRDQYSNMVDIVKEYGPGGDSDSGSSDEEAKEDYKSSNLKSLDKKKLEIVAQEFSMTFKEKIDNVIKLVRDKAYSEKISKQILHKYMRVLIYKYSTFLEIVKASHPSFYKETMNSHYGLLELKNILLEIDKS